MGSDPQLLEEALGHAAPAVESIDAGGYTRSYSCEGAFASALAGHLATEASAPLSAWADPGSTLRGDMAGDLRHALPWVAELLGLPSPS